jgi:hypothetical protein
MKPSSILLAMLGIGGVVYAQKLLALKNGITYEFGKLKAKMPIVRKEDGRDAYYIPILVTMLLKNSANDSIEIKNFEGSARFDGVETAKIALSNSFKIAAKGSAEMNLIFEVKLNIDFKKNVAGNFWELIGLLKKLVASGKPVVVGGILVTSLGNFPIKGNFYTLDYI